MITVTVEMVCLPCCASIGVHYCGLDWCTHRVCKPHLWEGGYPTPIKLGAK